jgi:hypothetical protein
VQMCRGADVQRWYRGGDAELQVAEVQRCRGGVQSSCILQCCRGGAEVQWCRDGAEVVVQRRWCRGGAVVVQTRFLCRGCCGSMVLRCRGAQRWCSSAEVHVHVHAQVHAHVQAHVQVQV